MHGDVGLSLSEIEDIDYILERPNSRSSLIRLGYINPPNIVRPIDIPAPSMEPSSNAVKTAHSLHKVVYCLCKMPCTKTSA